MIVTEKVRVSTRGHGDVHDITAHVARIVSASPLGSGIVTVFVVGSTAGVTTIEFEPGLVQDLKEAFDKIAREGASYHHDARWGDGNGHSHVRASLLGPSLVIPFIDGRLALGTWQQIVVVDFDVRPRTRELVIQLLGE